MATPEAEALYRSILGTYPDDIEAWSQLGEVLFHYGPEQGRSAAESRAPFERVLYFDPGYVSALVHLARVAAAEGRRAAVDSIVALIDKLSPSSDRDLGMRVLRAYAVGRGGPAARPRRSRARRGRDPGVAGLGHRGVHRGPGRRGGGGARAYRSNALGGCAGRGAPDARLSRGPSPPKARARRPD